MGTDEQKSVIHRKAMGGRDEFDARVMSPVKALRLALARVADDMFGLALTVTTVEQVKLAHRDVQREMGDDGLLLLDGAAGACGAARVDAHFLTALIEVQTTGAVRRTIAEARPFTRTDAAIVSPLMDAVMARYDAQLIEACPDHVAEAYRFGDMIEEARLLSLALEAPEYDLYRLTLDVEDGAKTGILKLLLPHRKVEAAREVMDETRPVCAFSLKEKALEAQVAMDVVLARIRLPLKEVCALASDMVLPLGAECLTGAQLIASGSHAVAHVCVGQLNGMRAVRLVAPARAADKESDRKPETAHGPVTGTATGDAEVSYEKRRPGVTAPEKAEGPESGSHKSGSHPGEIAPEELSAADLVPTSTAVQNHSEDA